MPSEHPTPLTPLSSCPLVLLSSCSLVLLFPFSSLLLLLCIYDLYLNVIDALNASDLEGSFNVLVDDVELSGLNVIDLDPQFLEEVETSMSYM